MTDPGLKDKIVLVTGANNPCGIGAATAKAFAAQGAAVFLTYLRVEASDVSKAETDKPGEAFYRSQQTKSADEVLQAIREQGGRAEAWEADLADPLNIPRLFDRIEKTFGLVDVLVNNAAHWEPDTFIPTGMELRNKLTELWTDQPTLTITPESHDRLFAVNSRAVALMMAEYAQRHVRRGSRWGRIINVSTDGASGFSGEVSYGASKHALESYSRAAASELGKLRDHGKYCVVGASPNRLDHFGIREDRDCPNPLGSSGPAGRCR